MNKAIRTTLSLAVSLVFLSAVTMAQAASNADKDKNKPEHHSHLSKAAFWRHHKDSKSAKQAQPTSTPSQSANAKTAQLKPASAKLSPGKTQKQEPQAKTVSKPADKSPSATKSGTVKKTSSSVKKSTAANTKTKTSASKSSATSKPKPQEPQTVSLKQ
jgi:hypothetical protein